MSCIVRGCRNFSQLKSGVKFHTFPTDPIRKNAWLAAVPIKGKFCNSARICSMHFKPEDYDPSRPSRLLKTAVPFYKHKLCQCCNKLECINMPATSHQATPTTIVTHAKAMLPPPAQNIKFVNMPSTSHQATPTTIVTHAKAMLPPPAQNIKFVNMPSTSHQATPTTIVTHAKAMLPPPAQNFQDDELHVKRPALRDFNIQVNVKTPREASLVKKQKILQQQVKRQGKKIENMKEIINVVRSYTSQSEIENILQGNFANICNTLNTNIKKKVTYSDDVKAFALTLHFYSPKAYNFLRKKIALPHESTLWRSLSTFNCSVGFLTEVLEYLKNEIPKKKFLKNVALIFDSMALRQDMAYCPTLGKVVGYVDLGNIPVEDPEQLASEALVFQIVSYTNYFKCPIGYFFTKNCLSGELLGQLIHTGIRMLHDIGITVRSLTCDGARSNVKAYESLGCSLSENDFRPYFSHINGVTKVYCILDPAHMLKLARNVLAEKGLKSARGYISFKYIQELHKVQEEEGLKLSNKVTGAHVDFKNKKMNVRLAAQVLSSSVADAIDFLRNSGNIKFVGSEATVEFLRIVDRLFDSVNSRSPFGTHFKSPLSLRNKDVWQGFFHQAEEYLKSLQIGEQRLLHHTRKTLSLGFLMNITSFKLLFSDLTSLQENPLKYLLTFKCSQDNLEIFFSCIRAKRRTHDNPSPLDFRYILRKLLFRNSVQPSINANCVDDTFHTNHVIDFRNNSRSLRVTDNSQNNNEESDNFVQMLRHLESPETSPYQDNVLYYITGFIVNKILQKNDCEFCHAILTTNKHKSDHDYSLNINKFSAFTSFVTRGKLCFASDASFEIIKYLNTIFKQTVTIGLANVDNVKSKLVMATLQKFQPRIQEIFTPRHPITDSITCLDLHETELVKYMANKFLQIRMSSYLKNHTQRILGDIRTKRQKLHKTILFSHV